MKTLEQRLKVGEGMQIKNAGMMGIEKYLLYGGLVSNDRFSLVVTNHSIYQGWAYNLYFPADQKEIRLEEGRVQVKSVDEKEIWITYTR